MAASFVRFDLTAAVGSAWAPSASGGLPMPDFERLVGQPLRDALDASGADVQRYAKQRAPVHTGALRNSINVEVDPSTVPMWASVGTNLIYARSVEFGRPPGKGVPVTDRATGAVVNKAFVDWVIRKLKVPRRDAVRVAIRISTKIKRRGIAPKPFLFPALAEARGDIQAAMNDAALDIAEAWG